MPSAATIGPFNQSRHPMEFTAMQPGDNPNPPKITEQTSP